VIQDEISREQDGHLSKIQPLDQAMGKMSFWKKTEIRLSLPTAVLTFFIQDMSTFCTTPHNFDEKIGQIVKELQGVLLRCHEAIRPGGSYGSFKTACT